MASKPFTRGGITYPSQAAYRRALAAREGFASRAARAKVVKAERQLQKLSAPQRQARSRALGAVSLIRQGAPVKKALETAGTTRSSLLKYGGDAVKREGRAITVAAADTLPRRMRVLRPDGVRFETVLSSQDASRLSAYWAAVKEYVRRGDPGALQQFEGASVTVKGQKVPLITDRETLNRMVAAGELDFEDLYELG